MPTSPAVTPEQIFTLAFQHHQAGRLTEAEALYRQILVAQPNHPRAIYQLANTLLQQGRLDEAIAAYVRLIALAPTLPEAHLHLGIALAGQRRFEEAAKAFRRAIELKPNDAEAHNNLGNVLKDQGKLEEAQTAYQQSLQHKPDLIPAIFNLGTTFKEAGRLDEAVTTFQRVLELRPDHGGAWNNMGNALQLQGKLPEAEIAYRRALQLNSNHAEACNNLANVLFEQGRMDEAVDAFHRALALRPDDAEVHGNLGNALKERGQMDEAVVAYRRAMELRPTSATAHSNLIFALHNQANCEVTLINAEHRSWNQQFSRPLKAFHRSHLNVPDPTRRLRIGYVSSDFRTHPVSFFLVPLLEAHDRGVFEIYCYADVVRSDEVTERFRACADVWRDVRMLTDERLADCIRADRIDILVDLAMHTAGNRLPVFARRSAPLQVSWLAYPGSSGLETIDYRFTDAHLDPLPDASGTILGGMPVRLADAWCCYSPIVHFPEATPLPALQTGRVTFGSLNQFGKLNEETLRRWAKLLQAVPGSRLILICPTGRASDRTRELFAKYGISSARLELVPRRPWPDYIRLFEMIDVALDSFPCNGMTTTCHALWMGLPVVTLCGASAVSRAGASLLHAINMRQWIAKDGDEYIQIAVELSRDIPRLAKLRAGLRQRMRSSPLVDAPRFARQIEGAYRALWQDWCSKQGIIQK